MSAELKDILSASGYCARCSSYAAEAQTLVIQSFDSGPRAIDRKSNIAEDLLKPQSSFIEDVCRRTSRSFDQVVNAISSASWRTADAELANYLRQILKTSNMGGLTREIKKVRVLSNRGTK